MRKAFLIVLAILFVLIGAATIYAVLNPKQVSDLLGGKKSQPTASAEKKEFDRKSAGSAPKPTPPAEAPKTDGAATPAATTATKPAETPRRPPPKASPTPAAATPAAAGAAAKATPVAVAKPKASDAKSIRRGRLMGELQEAPFGQPPLPALYPFDVVGRTFPDANTINLDIAIQNSSGAQWKTAYIVLRSAQHPAAVQFEVSDWQIDEVVGLNYLVPKAELEARIDKLRVISVEGDKRESALAERVAQNRRKIVEVRDSTSKEGVRSREGDTLQAPGLLALMGGAQNPVTGIIVKTAQTRDVGSYVLKVTIPEELLIGADYRIDVKETSPERQAVATQAREFLAASLKAQAGLAGFAKVVAAAPYETASKTEEATTNLEATRSALKSFNEIGGELAIKVQQSSDLEVKKAASVVAELSTLIVGQIEEMEKQVRVVDPHFVVQK